MRFSKALALLLFLSTPAQAQLAQTGAGKLATAIPFVGPGDIQSTGWTFFLSLQGFNAAYRGKALNVCAPSDSSCLDVNIVSNGNLDPAPLATLGCNNTTTICTIKTFYDQWAISSGNKNCGGAACDYSEATISFRALLVMPDIITTGCTSNAFPCAQFVNSFYTTATSTTGTPINSLLTVLQRCTIGAGNGCGNTSGTLIADLPLSCCGLFLASNSPDFFWGATHSGAVAAADTIYHVMIGVANTSSSSFNVDNVSASFTTLAESPAFGQLGADSNTPPLNDIFWGYVSTIAVNSQAFSAPTISALNANQHSNWGFSIVAWGDSLTAGGQDLTPTTYPLTLGTLFTPNRKVVNEGVGGDGSAQILTRFQANQWAWNSPTVIWSGRNDFTTPSQVQSDIATMVADLTSSKYIVMSILNSENEPSGNGNYTTIINLNSALSSTYGSHYLDVRSMLVAAYNPANPIDVLDHNSDIPPYSLRAIDVFGSLTAGIDNSTCTFTLTPTGGTVIVGDILIIGTENIYISGVTAGTAVTACTRGYGSVATIHSLGDGYQGVDPLHLNAAGYNLVANYVFSKIQALGGW